MPIRIEHGKPVAHGLKRIPQPPFGDGVGGADLLQFLAHLRVFLPRDVDFIGQHPRMFAKLAIRLEQLAALLFQEPFRREAAATFFGKFLFQRHTRPC